MIITFDICHSGWSDGSGSGSVNLYEVGASPTQYELTHVIMAHEDPIRYLAYLDDNRAITHLADAARNEPAFRWHALTALSAMDEGATSLRTPEWKRIGRQLYDLSHDPGETTDVAAEHAGVAEKLRRIKVELVTEGPSIGPVEAPVSPELDAICRKMMAKRPDQRQQSMSEVIRELEACLVCSSVWLGSWT